MAGRELRHNLAGHMTRVALGLRANWRQFTLLVVVNAFVGAMVGLERAVLPAIAATEFHITSTTLVLSFIAAFGLAKAATNLAAGWLADRRHRRTTLLAGWLIGLPVPLLILWAPSWWWIVAANLLLGINQGLAWSATVIMKIDLVGPRRRGLAMGLNEFAGYVAVGLAGLAGGFAAARYGMRPGTAYLGLAIVAAGLVLSWFTRETAAYADHESAGYVAGPPPRLRDVVRSSLWSDPGLFSLSQAGLVNNLNDGLAWGVFPLLFLQSGLTLTETGMLAAVYPVTWGVCQLATGALSDWWGRKGPIVAGMALQGGALVSMTIVNGYAEWAGALVTLGLGTALVYPTLLAAVGDLAHPSWRGRAVGVYRMWRDLGYALGALVAGVLADAFGTTVAIDAVGVLTLLSGVLVAVRLPPTRAAQDPRTLPE
jgi:MFS family permease